MDRAEAGFTRSIPDGLLRSFKIDVFWTSLVGECYRWQLAIEE